MTNIFDNAGSVIHDNKIVASIVTGDGGVIYEALCVEFTFTGTTLTQYSSGSFKGIDMTIDYGDGTIETTTGKFGHTYSENGTYTVKIYGVIKIEDNCFYGCTGLISINIPNGITSLENACFYNCSGLTSINIPSSVTIIESDCFRYCTGLTSINIPSSVTSVGNHCFSGCTNLTSITLPDGVTRLGASCFRDCTDLSSISIPNTVTSVGNYCFYDCTNLTSITLNWTTSNQIITYNSNWITRANANVKFKIPTGTKSLYIEKGYPSNKLDDSSISSVNFSATKTTLSKSHNDTTTLTATVIDSNNQSVSGETVQIYNGNTLIGTMTESNGTYSYTYTSQGSGDLSLSAKCSEVSSSPILIQDYLLVPPLNGTDAITKWTNMTNNTTNGIFNSHGSYLSNGWDNSGLWQLDFDVKTSNWKYIGLMPVCAAEINPFTDAKNTAYSMTCWEGISFFGGMGLSSWDSYPSNFSKITKTNTSYHITIKKLSSTKVEIHIGDYVAIGNYNNLPNHSTLYIGTRDNPSSRNYGGIPQLSNIVVKPL